MVSQAAPAGAAFLNHTCKRTMLFSAARDLVPVKMQGTYLDEDEVEAREIMHVPDRTPG